MRSVDELRKEYHAMKDKRGEGSILAKLAWKELNAALHKDIRREVRAYRKAKRKAA